MYQYSGCDIIVLQSVTIEGNRAKCARIFLYYFYYCMWFCIDLNKKFSFKKGQCFWSLVDKPLVETTGKESHELIYFLTHYCGGCVKTSMEAGRPVRGPLWQTSISLFIAIIVSEILVVWFGTEWRWREADGFRLFLEVGLTEVHRWT